jgi:hypothetical protein
MRQSKKEKDDELDLRRNPVNVFQCGCKDCEKIEAMPFNDFKKHLLDVHKLNSDQMKGKKQMTMHMDGSYWFSYNYTWTLESGLVFHQYIRMARDKNDLMRF